MTLLTRLFKSSNPDTIKNIKEYLKKLASLGNDPIEYYPKGTERYLKVKEKARIALDWVNDINNYPLSVQLDIVNFTTREINFYYPNQ